MAQQRSLTIYAGKPNPTNVKVYPGLPGGAPSPGQPQNQPSATGEGGTQPPAGPTPGWLGAGNAGVMVDPGIAGGNAPPTLSGGTPGPAMTAGWMSPSVFAGLGLSAPVALSPDLGSPPPSPMSPLVWAALAAVAYFLFLR